MSQNTPAVPGALTTKEHARIVRELKAAGIVESAAQPGLFKRGEEEVGDFVDAVCDGLRGRARENRPAWLTREFWGLMALIGALPATQWEPILNLLNSLPPPFNGLAAILPVITGIATIRFAQKRLETKALQPPSNGGPP